ncbi:MAG: TerC family protein [Acidobacteriia bacterium]|nr:TerC family protein [Terriglobia bacterium]
MAGNWLFWVLFNAFVLAMLVLDLGVFHRKAHAVRYREALAWTVVWVGLAATFAVLIYHFGHLMTGSWAKPNRQLALEFVTGYLIEESLSVDNLFVFLLIFRHFAVPRQIQHKVLFWGILGALIMRAIFIATGVTLIRRVQWIIYVFGAFLVYTGVKLAVHRGVAISPKDSWVLKLFRKHVRVTHDYKDDRFFEHTPQGWFATPLALVLVLVETTDVLFATDSIPAVLAVTQDPFIVYTSNVFAVLGLRSLYFALSGMMELFHYLHYGLAVILMFIGAKMLLSHYYDMPIHLALGVVAVVLAVSIGASIALPKKHEPEAGGPSSP